jgi:hypothetical protein
MLAIHLYGVLLDEFVHQDQEIGRKFPGMPGIPSFPGMC